MSTPAERRKRAQAIARLRAEKQQAARDSAAKKAALKRKVAADAASAKRAKIAKADAQAMTAAKNDLARSNAAQSSKLQRSAAKRIKREKEKAKKEADKKWKRLEKEKEPREPQEPKEKGPLQGRVIGAISRPQIIEIEAKLATCAEMLSNIQAGLLAAHETLSGLGPSLTHPDEETQAEIRAQHTEATDAIFDVCFTVIPAMPLPLSLAGISTVFRARRGEDQ